MQAFWDDGSPIAGIDVSSQGGKYLWSLEADFDITQFKTKCVGKDALSTLRAHFPEMPDCIDKESARKLMIYRAYAFEQIKHFDSVLSWNIAAAMCLISKDAAISTDAEAWHSSGQPMDWSSPGLNRFKFASARIEEVCQALG